MYHIIYLVYIFSYTFWLGRVVAREKMIKGKKHAWKHKCKTSLRVHKACRRHCNKMSIFCVPSSVATHFRAFSFFRAFSSVVRQMPGLNSQVGARSALVKSSCHCVVLSSFCCYCVGLLFMLFCYYGVVLYIDCVYCNTATGC